MLQILSASPNPTAPQVSNTLPAVVRHPFRPKQPQLRRNPANSAASSPTPAQQATSVRYLPIVCILFDCIISIKVLFLQLPSSPRATPPQVATQQQTVHQQLYNSSNCSNNDNSSNSNCNLNYSNIQVAKCNSVQVDRLVLYFSAEGIQCFLPWPLQVVSFSFNNKVVVVFS